MCICHSTGMWGVWSWLCQEPDLVCTSLPVCRCSRTALSWLLPSTSSLPDLCSCTSDHMSTTTRNSLYVDTHACTCQVLEARQSSTPLNRGYYDFIITQINWSQAFAYMFSIGTFVHKTVSISSISLLPQPLTLSHHTAIFIHWLLHCLFSSLVPSLTAALSIDNCLLPAFGRGHLQAWETQPWI